MALEGIRLSFTQEAIDYIAQKAYEYKLGARGLRSICEAVMKDAMFELPSSGVREFRITQAYAAEKIDRSRFGMLKAA
jgi:ATP-dependent Clp protease ATP-binding subunit ClpX